MKMKSILNSYQSNERRVTFREILASFVIIGLMLSFGFIISNNINNSLLEKYHEYDTALQIDNDKELFEYGMKTNVGNAFVYGELKCLDPVTYPEIGGKYSYVKKVKERYTEHTRTETYTDSKGNTHTRIVTYWEWDYVDSWEQHSTKISFLDVEFPYGKIKFSGDCYIDTIRESSNIRYKYYGSPIKETGTLYACLEEKDVKNVSFNRDKTIDETINSYESHTETIIFWIAWGLLTGGLVAGFYFINNNWLEDKRKII